MVKAKFKGWMVALAILNQTCGQHEMFGFRKLDSEDETVIWFKLASELNGSENDFGKAEYRSALESKIVNLIFDYLEENGEPCRI